MEHHGFEGRDRRAHPGLDLDGVATHVVEAGAKVHASLGPGLLEAVYEHCLAHELQARGLAFQRQPPSPAAHSDPAPAYGYQLDFVVADAIVVEINAVDAPARLHEPEVLAWLRASGYRLGVILDFTTEPFGDGVRRVAI